MGLSQFLSDTRLISGPERTEETRCSKVVLFLVLTEPFSDHEGLTIQQSFTSTSRGAHISGFIQSDKNWTETGHL